MWESPAALPPNNPGHQQINYDGSSVEALHRAASVPDFHPVLSNHLPQFPQHCVMLRKFKILGAKYHGTMCLVSYDTLTLHLTLDLLCPIIQFVAFPGPCLLPSRHSHPVLLDMPFWGHWFLNLAIHQDHLGTLESHLGIRILEAPRVILR